MRVCIASKRAMFLNKSSARILTFYSFVHTAIHCAPIINSYYVLTHEGTSGSNHLHVL
jgi:hypothetical protein